MRSMKKSSYLSFKNGTATDRELSQADLVNIDQFIKNANSDLNQVFNVLQGEIRFGTTVNLKPGENIMGQWVTVADSGTANTEFSVTHSLSKQSIGIVPANYLVTSINKGGVVYLSGTTWTTTTAYFKCSAANAAINIFLMP